MGKITVNKCPIEGLFTIEPTVYGDERGYFVETYNKQDMDAAGLECFADFIFKKNIRKANLCA